MTLIPLGDLGPPELNWALLAPESKHVFDRRHCENVLGKITQVTFFNYQIWMVKHCKNIVRYRLLAEKPICQTWRKN